MSENPWLSVRHRRPSGWAASSRRLGGVRSESGQGAVRRCQLRWPVSAPVKNRRVVCRCGARRRRHSRPANRVRVGCSCRVFFACAVVPGRLKGWCEIVNVYVVLACCPVGLRVGLLVDRGRLALKLSSVQYKNEKCTCIKYPW